MNKYYTDKVFKDKIDNLPTNPGSYQMKDINNKIIYVGKAKNLKNRVSQYFLRPQEGKVQRMVNEIEDFDIIETSSEKEALLLEINLIQKYYPKYNILLKDGKMYPYISLKKKGDPFLKISRNDKDKSFYHYGPFPNSTMAYRMINILNKIFPLRKCNQIPKKPCLYYYLGQCLGPCINKIDEKDYKDIDSHIKKFLNGDTSFVIQDVKRKMLEASEKLDFELANEYKKTLESINHIIEKQNIMMQDHVDRDVVAFSTRDGYISFLFLLYRHGILLGKDVFISQITSDIPTLLVEVISQYYLNPNHSHPKEVLIPIEEIIDLLNQSFEDIKFLFPFKGSKKDIINMALTNAKTVLDEHFMTARLEDDNLQLLEQLQNLIGMDKTPLDIEIYDNSHLQGADAVGVMVKFINGEKSKKDYRKFIIRSENKKDDLSSMSEVIFRRMSHLKDEKFSKTPDLIICDGGENQVRATLNVLENFKDVNIKVIGLVKNDKHETSALLDGETGEIIDLDKKSNLFYFLMRMQDEVHRYAITFFRRSHSKSLFSTFYDDIKGIGAKKKRILIDRYPTLDMLFQANFDELKSLVGQDCAENISKKIEYFKAKEN